MATQHLIGLLLATERDWPAAFESVLSRIGSIRYAGERHEFSSERITNEPFDLRSVPRYSLVIDRLAWWYDVPREWLKKISLMNDVYLLNNPFTFQAMEKHSAYCAMMRLGVKVPDTWLIPHRVPPANPRFVPMAERYNPSFDLDEVAEQVGYPLFMKPFDGNTWTAVTRIASSRELHRSYEESGERLMHLQAAVEGYDVFTRCLSIGPQTRVMHYDVTQEHHYRYTPDRDFLTPALEHEVTTISRLINAFFRWDFNSCEAIVKDGQAYPIDFANASPDLALTSLSYHFPWAIKSLIAWCLFSTVTGRSMSINQSTRDYFDVGDREELAYEEKLERYRELADAHLQAVAFAEFRDAALPHLDEEMVEYIESAEFDDHLVRIIRTEEPPDMQESLIERTRVLVRAGAADAHVTATY